jgi:retron-type reverse transcriptase
VREPKQRLISAAPYRDRVVHHALINVIAPLFERNFISDSYANRVGKGTHAAVDRAQAFLRRFRYVLQCDVVKFFPSVDHAILKRLLRSRIRDLDVLWLCDSIIDASNAQEAVLQYFPGDDLLSPLERRRGLPIGNMTSQFWANVYLHGLDNFVKRGLRVPGYLRYVDDFLLFGDDKASLVNARERLKEFLAGLRLRIHERRAQVRPTHRPTRFLGYRCWPTYRFLTKEGIRRFRRRGRLLQRLYASGRISWDYVKLRLAAWNAHAATADCRALRRRVLGRLVFSRLAPG